MEAAAGSDEALIMSPTNGSVKKKFRARKTMTASCREQLATLKLKNSSKSENTGKEPPNKAAQQPELICETNFTAQDNAESKIGKSQGVFPNGLKVSIEVSQVDSGINIGCSYNETWEGVSQKSEDAPFSHTTHFVVRDFNASPTENHIAGSDQVTSPADTASQALSEDPLQIAEGVLAQDAEMECEPSSIECGTIAENLNASITVKIIDEDQSCKKTPAIDDVTSEEPPDTAMDVTSEEAPDTAIGVTSEEPPDTAIDVTSEEPPDKAIDVTSEEPPDTDIDVTSEEPPDTAIDVTSEEPPDTAMDVTSEEAPDTAIDVTSEEPPDTAIDVTSEEPPDKAIDVASEEPPDKAIDVASEEPPDTDIAEVSRNELELSNFATDGSNAVPSPSTFSAVSEPVLPESDDAVGDCEKKRSCSESSDVPEAKRAKTSTSVLLDEIQCLIDRRINILFENNFDQRMQTLMGQADLIRKKGNRTDDAVRHLRNIRRLERRLNCAVELQKKLAASLGEQVPTGALPQEVCNTNATADPSVVIPPADTSATLQTPSPAPNPTSSSTELVVLSDNESEQPSHSEQGQTEGSKTSSQKVDSAAAMKKIMESIKEHREKARSSQTVVVKAVIDLTDEEQRCGKDPVATECPASAKESEENVVAKCSAKNDLSSNNNATLSSDRNEEQQSVPTSPQSENLQESEAVPKSASTPEISSLKPPQKPQLRLAQVQNPKGIALSWNVDSIDPSCAPAKSYCLYVHQGDPSNPKKQWKKISEIKALPLPMACTLSKFAEETTYSFVVRARDVEGRFGPLCDVQSTTLKPLGSSKKS